MKSNKKTQWSLKIVTIKTVELCLLQIYEIPKKFQPEDSEK